MLPDCSLNHETKYVVGTINAMKITTDRVGFGPDAYCPLRISGRCQSPQITPLMRTGRGIFASKRRVSM